MLKRVHIVVEGRVQGVFFRYYTQNIAKSLGLKGWVRNLRTGDKVEIVAEGEEEKLKQLLEWSRKGPPMARVTDLKYNWEEYKGEFNDFLIEKTV